MSQRNRTALVAAIAESFSPENKTLLAEYIMRIITDLRFDNDTEEGINLAKNQGAIREYLELARQLELPVERFYQ